MSAPRSAPGSTGLPNLGVDHVKIKSPSAASGHPTSRTAALDLGQHGNGCSVRLSGPLPDASPGSRSPRVPNAQWPAEQRRHAERSADQGVRQQHIFGVWCVGRRGVSGSGRAREAAPSAAVIAAARVTWWFSASPLGLPRRLQSPGSAFAVAGRGCATTGPRRDGRRVGVLRRPPTAEGGWRGSRLG